MKRPVVILGALLCACAAGCAATFAASGSQAGAGEEKQLHIVTTIFPEYDWVRQIMGSSAEDAQITFLMNQGVDLHSFQPAVQDLVAVRDSDLFVYVGGESDVWVEDALQDGKDGRIVLNLMEVLADSVVEEEIVEGMQEAEHEDVEHAEAEHEDAAADPETEQEDASHTRLQKAHAHSLEDAEYDEHVWLSLRNAEVIVQALTDALCEIDPENADTYETNAAAYTAQLDDLDKAYAQAVEEADKDTLLFAGRFPFRYLTQDYGLNYYAAFAGCSAETGASFETIAFLAGKTDELGLSSLLTIKGDDQSIAVTVQNATSAKDQQILVLDSMQSTTSEDVSSGASYLQIMEENLAVLKTALGHEK